MPVTDSAASEVAAVLPYDDDDADHQTVDRTVDFGGIAVHEGAWDMKVHAPTISRTWCNTFVDRNGMIARMALRKWYLELEC